VGYQIPAAALRAAVGKLGGSRIKLPPPLGPDSLLNTRSHSCCSLGTLPLRHRIGSFLRWNREGKRSSAKTIRSKRTPAWSPTSATSAA